MISHSHYTSAAALLQVHCILDAGCRKKEKIKVQQDKLAKSNPFQRVFPEAHPFLAQVFSLSSLLEHSSNCSIRLSRLSGGPRGGSELVTVRKTCSQPLSSLNEGPGSCPPQASYPLLTPNHPRGDTAHLCPRRRQPEAFRVIGK